MAKVSVKHGKKKALASKRKVRAASKQQVFKRRDLKKGLPIKKLMILGE